MEKKCKYCNKVYTYVLPKEQKFSRYVKHVEKCAEEHKTKKKKEEDERYNKIEAKRLKQEEEEEDLRKQAREHKQWAAKEEDELLKEEAKVRREHLDSVPYFNIPFDQMKFAHV